MSWVALSPPPPDFCGHPPCPKCFHWLEGDKPPMSGLHKMALDLLQKPLDDLARGERRKLDTVARKMHRGGIAAFASPPDDSPPPPADIGMSSMRQLNGRLKEMRRKTAAPPPRQLTCDEIYARKAEQEAAEKVKRKEKEERLKEAREIAAVFAEADRGRQDRQQFEDQRMLREVDPGFVNYCRERGIYSAQEIYARWQREYMRGPSYMMDPVKGTSRYGY